MFAGRFEFHRLNGTDFDFPSCKSNHLKPKIMQATYLIAFVMSAGLAFGQTSRELSIKYLDNGGKTLVDNDGIEQVTLNLRPDGLASFYEVNVIRDSRVIRYYYLYDANNRLSEEKTYSSGHGYRKTTYAYDERGYKIEEKSYETKNPRVEADWILISRLSNQFDHLGRRVRFEYIGYPGQTGYTFEHRMSEYAYTGNGNQYVSLEYEYDANGQIIKQGKGKGTGSVESPSDETIVQDHSQGTSSLMIVTTSNAFKNESYYVEGRMTEDVFYGLKSGNGNVFTNVYELDYLVQNNYVNGKLTEQIIRDDNGPVVKRSILYSDDQPTELRTYYSTSAGAWSLVKKEKFKANLRSFFPPLTGNNFTNITEAPSAEPVIGTTPSVNASSVSNVLVILSGTSLQEAIDQSKSYDGASSSAEIDAATKRLLTHMMTILNYQNSGSVSEADLIQLAVKELVEKYRDDLKQLNDAYLSSQQALFD